MQIAKYIHRKIPFTLTLDFWWHYNSAQDGGRLTKNEQYRCGCSLKTISGLKSRQQQHFIKLYFMVLGKLLDTLNVFTTMIALKRVLFGKRCLFLWSVWNAQCFPSHNKRSMEINSLSYFINTDVFVIA